MKRIDERSKAEKVLSLRNLSQIFLIKSMVVSGVIEATTDDEAMDEYCTKYAEIFEMLAMGAIETNSVDTAKVRGRLQRAGIKLTS